MAMLVRSAADEETAREFMAERRERCKPCMPSLWTEEEDGGTPPCKSPLLPVLKTGPGGIREVMWEPCAVFVEWARKRQERVRKKSVRA